jgi:hypothetical protein
MPPREVSIVVSWWDASASRPSDRVIVAVYGDKCDGPVGEARRKAIAWVAAQQQEARNNPALRVERDHKHWAITVHEVLE